MRPRVLVLVAGLIAGGCQASAGPSLSPPVAHPWDRDDVRPVLDHPFLEAHPDLTNLSLFAEFVSGPIADRPDSSHRGAYGIGNGKAFAILGLTDPLNTLHGIVGPVYEKDARFFGDTALRPVVNGVVRDFDSESIARPRGTGLVVTRGDIDELTVWTVDFAPAPVGVDPLDRPSSLSRVVMVRNRGNSAVDVALEIAAQDDLVEEGDWLVDTLPEDGRTMVYVAVGFERVAAGAPWRLAFGAVPPGTIEPASMSYVIGVDRDDALARAAEIAKADRLAQLDDTLAWWATDSARGTQFQVDDPWLTDLIDGTRVLLRVQQTAAGGISPMSRYTGVWLRDMIGPARFLSRIGLHDDVRQAIDYLELCHRARGDIGNSCSSGLAPEDVSTAPDWASLPPFSGRTAAEGPSYLVLTWAQAITWTGDTSGLAAAWPYLRRAVMAQSMTDEGLQSWSGDETFRLAMNVALGYPLETPWQDMAWSSNSAMVMIAAANFLADHAAEAGHPEDEAPLRDRADRARAALIDKFVQPEGHFASVKLMDEAAAPVTLPFEDVNLNAIWSGAFAPDDAVANADLDSMLKIAGHPDGSVQSTPNPIYDMGTFAGGAATGMVPGFVLYDLSETGDPGVLGAFDQAFAYASLSGEYAEAILYSDRSPLQPVYDRVGLLGDVSARYRPWEGGIVLDAVVDDLLGASPLTVAGKPTLYLRPRVPNGLDHLNAGPIDAPGARVVLDMSWHDGWRVDLTCDSDVACDVWLDVPLGTWEDVVVTLDGPTQGSVITRPRGERMARFAPATIEPHRTATWWVHAS